MNKILKTALLIGGAVVVSNLLTGCKIFGGVMVHPNKYDKPEYDGTNPLGFIRAETDDGKYFCQHTSSIPDLEKGYGLNACGVNVRLY